MNVICFAIFGQLENPLMSKNITSLKQYKIEYAKSIKDPAAFWEEKAEKFTWYKKWAKYFHWDFTKPEVKWFEGGKLNITENCLR